MAYLVWIFFFFVVLVWQELAVDFGFLCKGAWVAGLVGKRVRTLGAAALPPHRSPGSQGLASRGRETSGGECCWGISEGTRHVLCACTWPLLSAFLGSGCGVLLGFEGGSRGPSTDMRAHPLAGWTAITQPSDMHVKSGPPGAGQRLSGTPGGVTAGRGDTGSLGQDSRQC